MIHRCFALPYYVYCLRLRCLVSFLFYSTIHPPVCLSFFEVVTFRVFNFQAVSNLPLQSVLLCFLFLQRS
ncbi:Uncharacterised protein [Neisseria animalis]|nr:Uncharacterised protein [Neisseria animalis]